MRPALALAPLLAALAGCPLVALDDIIAAAEPESEPATGWWLLQAEVPEDFRGPHGAAVRLSLTARDGVATAQWLTVGSLVIDGDAVPNVTCDEYPLTGGYAITHPDGWLSVSGLTYDAGPAQAVADIELSPRGTGDDEDDGTIAVDVTPEPAADLAERLLALPYTSLLWDYTDRADGARHCEAP